MQTNVYIVNHAEPVDINLRAIIAGFIVFSGKAVDKIMTIVITR